ncbi:neprilysin-4-like [Condylostylus longicornis]|uniref:neprilysin-4-like n=1 Tax=Condylostylus longicornis TaxID=2530218 RepID=UPI00244DC109|nr:neprilysin-4-like [Condylostylus longicornis]
MGDRPYVKNEKKGDIKSILPYLPKVDQDLPNSNYIIVNNDIADMPSTNLINSYDNIKEHVNNILKYIDPTIDPCKDFYKYTCGNWIRYHQIPNDHDSYNLFDKLNDQLRDSIYDILTTEINSVKSDDSIVKTTELARILFNSCIDMNTINDRKSQPLLEFLKKLNGFPLLDKNWNENEFNLEEILIQLSLYDMENIFHFAVDTDLENTKKFIIYILNPSLGLDNEGDYLESDNNLHLNAYRTYIIDILKILNANEYEVENVADEIIDLEIKLANVTDIKELTLIELYKSETIGDLMKNYPKFNWKYYLNKSFNSNFNDDTKIGFFTGPKLKLIYDIVINTDKRIMANYLNWIAIDRLVKYLDDEFKVPIDNLSKAISGSESDTQNRGLSCATTTNIRLGTAVSAIYIRKYFDENAKAEVFKIGQEIKNIFRENLYDSEWLDDETRHLAEIKVNKTGLDLGFPNFLLNETALNKYYKDLELQNGKYFENILNIRKFTVARDFRKLDKNYVAEDEWSVNPTVVNAYFENPKNRIIMPASFLQPPIYNKNFPKSMNYGAIGAFIGHELTHGFDSDGRSFDKDGNIGNWWTNKSLEFFMEKEQCFVDQYDKFLLYNHSLNGHLTRRENIADNGGLQLSFKVYRKWLNSMNEEEKQNEILPGLEFLAPEQLFFLSFAQSWCDFIRPEAVETKLADVHPPGAFRVLGTLQNFDEFAKAFQCPLNSPMNPSKKCKLW